MILYLPLLLTGALAIVSAQDCYEDPAASLTSQLMELVGDRAARTCAVCSGEVMSKVQELSTELSSVTEEYQKEVGDVQAMMRSFQQESQDDRQGIRSSLAEAMMDREDIRESLTLAEKQTNMKLEELRADVEAVGNEAHNNLTAEVVHLRAEIQNLRTTLENLQSYVKGGSRTTRDAPATCAEKQVMLAPTGYLAPVESGTYKNNTDCSWVIERPAGVKIKITWLMFALERSTDCKCDYVEVWDGTSTKELVGGQRWCGYLDPPTMTSKSNKVEIKFHSNNSGVYAGFKVKYESIED